MSLSQPKDKNYDKDYSVDSVIPGIELTMAIARKVRASTLDYALGSAILGVIPVYGRWIPLLRVTLLIVLIVKMVGNISHFWGDRRGQGIGEILSCILGVVASIALASIAWLGILLLSLWIPFIDILARAIAYGILTFNIGRTMSHYYYNPHVLDLKSLRKALKFYKSLKHS